MPEIPIRNRPIRQSSLAVVVGAVLIGLVLVIAGLVILREYHFREGYEKTGGGVLLVGGLLLITISIILHLLVVVALKAEANINRINNNSLDSIDVTRRLEPLIKTIADNSQFSDAALSITHREKELEALRQAIREDMFGGQWEAALYLIDEIERRFGYKEETKSLRAELAQVREMTIGEKINEAVSHVEKLMSEYRWERAREEMERLIKLFPRHEQVIDLPAELNRRREAHKQELLVQWQAAVARDAIDQGIAILTELDPYLTREEAQSLQDSARHVFKARLLNLGVQFSLAVSESRWRDALEVGLLLRREFPNSRMAQEVAEKTDVLRVRAGFTTDAEVIQRRPAGSG